MQLYISRALILTADKSAAKPAQHSAYEMRAEAGLEPDGRFSNSLSRAKRLIFCAARSARLSQTLQWEGLLAAGTKRQSVGISEPGPLLGVQLSRAVTAGNGGGSSALDPQENKGLSDHRVRRVVRFYSDCAASSARGNFLHNKSIARRSLA
jgi:hypothetical protein